jgi:hypothetical protein
LLASAGVSSVVVRAIGQDAGLAADDATTAYLAIVGTGSILVHALAAVGVGLAPCTAQERAVLFWMLAGNVVGAVSALPLFDARHRQLRPTFVTVVVDLLALAGFVLAAVADVLTPTVAMALMAGKWMAIALGHFALLHALHPIRWVYRNGGNFPAGSPSLPSQIRAFLRPGFRLLLAGLLFLVPLSGGVVATRLLRSPGEAVLAETATIGLATQVALVFATAWWQVTRILQPHILGPSGEEAWFVRQLVLGTTAALLALALGLAGAAAVVFLWLLPPIYRNALIPTALMLLAGVLQATAGIVGLYLHRRHREGALLAGYLVGGVVYVPAVVALTLALGPTGAALAAGLSAAVTLAALAIVLRRPVA